MPFSSILSSSQGCLGLKGYWIFLCLPGGNRFLPLKYQPKQANYWHSISRYFTGPSQPEPGIQEMERDAIPFPYALPVNVLLSELPLFFLSILFTCCLFCSLCPSVDVCFFFPISCLAAGWPGTSGRCPGCFLSDPYL